MHAIGPDALRQFWIGSDQQDQAARAANTAQSSRDVRPIGCAEMAIHHGRTAQQALGDIDRIGRSGRIGEEKQRWNGRSASVAVEPARKRG